MNTNGSNKDFIDSIIKKLFVQFRFNFEYLGLNEADQFCPYGFLLEAKKKNKKNLDGSPIIILKNGDDPFGLDRICHTNSLFAFGHELKPYKFKDDGYEALHHVSFEAFPFMYGINLFDLLERTEAVPLVFPTDFNYFEESLTKKFLINKKYEKGYMLPCYHSLHNMVFTKEYFRTMEYNPEVLNLQYKISDYPKEYKENIIIINFALSMLFNIILVESAFVDLFGHKNIKSKIDFVNAIEKNNKEGLVLISFLFSCLHSFVYAVTYGIFRNRYAMTNKQPLKTPHGSFYFGTDDKRRPFKDVLQESIKALMNYKYDSNSLSKEEKEAMLWLSDIFGIGYWTNPEIYNNKHYWNKVDYSPKGLKDETFITGATKSSPLWKMWYWWWGAYWLYPDLISICRREPEAIKKQQGYMIPQEASELKLQLIYESSKLVKEYMLQKLKDPNIHEIKKNMFKWKLKEIWDIS